MSPPGHLDAYQILTIQSRRIVYNDGTRAFRSSRLPVRRPALIAERGPQAVTVDSLAERLKAPKGSFYYRFASRDALLGEVWLETVLAYQQGFVAAIGGRRTESRAPHAGLGAPSFG